MAIKVYEYEKCSTCRNALKFLDRAGVKYERLPIVDRPPSMTELKTMLKFLKADGGTFKNLFNTSGVQYRELGVADRIKNGLLEEDALEMLARNGKLIKRPFLLTPRGGTVGFREEEWKRLLK